jgi:hypothetical protein
MFSRRINCTGRREPLRKTTKCSEDEGGRLLPADVSMIMPRDSSAVAVSLDKPVAFDVGSRFAIREGGKTVGSGIVTGIEQCVVDGKVVSAGQRDRVGRVEG